MLMKIENDYGINYFENEKLIVYTYKCYIDQK